MPLNLRRRFGGRTPLPPLWLMDDIRIAPANYASLRDYRIEHEEVHVLERPLAVDRQYFLTRGTDSLKLELALCLEGAAAAAELLFQRGENFQREADPAAVQDLALTRGIGDIGVAWGWNDKDRNGVAGFVRHNAMAFLQGSYEALLNQAADIDAGLKSVPAGMGPSERDDRSFDLPQPETALRVAPGGRLDLGLARVPTETHFFMASGGSVNRDPKQPTFHYFRAGLIKGPQLITVLRVGSGLLPSRQTIRITIE